MMQLLVVARKIKYSLLGRDDWRGTVCVLPNRYNNSVKPIVHVFECPVILFEGDVVEVGVRLTVPT